MAKAKSVQIQGIEMVFTSPWQNDEISLSDLARHRNAEAKGRMFSCGHNTPLPQHRTVS
jgi:hypothetical protein